MRSAEENVLVWEKRLCKAPQALPHGLCWQQFSSWEEFLGFFFHGEMDELDKSSLYIVYRLTADVG